MSNTTCLRLLADAFDALHTAQRHAVSVYIQDVIQEAKLNTRTALIEAAGHLDPMTPEPANPDDQPF